jgi:hypothetical protein
VPGPGKVLEVRAAPVPPASELVALWKVRLTLPEERLGLDEHRPKLVTYPR